MSYTPPAGVSVPAWTKPKNAATAPITAQRRGAAEGAIDEVRADRRPHHAGHHEALRDRDQAVELQPALQKRRRVGEHARGEAGIAGARRRRRRASASAPADPRRRWPGKSPIATAGACSARRGLERLRGDDDADPQHDRHAGLHRHQRVDQRGEAAERDDGEEDAVRASSSRSARRAPSSPDGRCRSWSGSTSRSAAATTEPMPFTASDGSGRIGVAGGLGRLDVLQRAEDVEQPHRQHHRHQVLRAAADG